MIPSNLPAPKEVLSPSLKIISTIFLNLCPNLVKRHYRLTGEMDAEYENAKQRTLEENLRNKNIIFPPGTTIEHMNQAFYEDMLIALGKSQNRDAVFEEFYSHFADGEIEKLPPLREEIALPLFEYAGECTTKEAQKRWAKLITGECRNPGSISLRTVRILNSMSTEDAEMLESFAHICSGRIIFLKNAQDNDLEKIVHLSSLGLIIGLSHSTSTKLLPTENYALKRSSVIGYIQNNSSQEIKLRGYGLTKSGVEIMNLSSILIDPKLILKNMNVSENDVKIVLYDSK